MYTHTATVAGIALAKYSPQPWNESALGRKIARLNYGSKDIQTVVIVKWSKQKAKNAKPSPTIPH